MQNFHTLIAWQKAHAIAVDLCRFAVTIPPRYVRLADQIIASASSMPANLAEGCGRRSNADRARFFDYTIGSASETEARLLILRDLTLLDEVDADAYCTRIIEIRSMTHALMVKTRSTTKNERS